MSILILSTTNGSNFQLGKKVQKTLDSLGLEHKLISLENYHFPLYTPVLEEEGIPSAVVDLANLLSEAKGLVILCPEYNGSFAPVLVNAITWISCVGEDWRAAFNHKFSVIGTHSGGGGQKVCMAIKQTLEHLGSIVYPRMIITSDRKPYDEKSGFDIFLKIKKYIES